MIARGGPSVTLLALALALALPACRAPGEESGAVPPAPLAEGDPSAATPPTRVGFEPFGPTPGTTAEQLASWSALVRERFLADPLPERAAELDGTLAALDVVDATPAFLNAVIGLDMADAGDVLRAVALTRWWYDAQAQRLKLLLDDDPDPAHAANRLAQLTGWARWWTARLARPGALETYRAQVEETRAFLERDREARRRGEGAR